MNEAVHACNNGLLATKSASTEQLEIAGKRLIQDVIEPIERIR
jgi:hypothetical protein